MHLSKLILFLTKQAFNFTKLAKTNTPDKLILELADYKFSNSSSKLRKLHLYPFGGMKKTSEWMNAILEKPIKINNKNEFEIFI